MDSLTHMVLEYHRDFSKKFNTPWTSEMQTDVLAKLNQGDLGV